MASSTFLYLSKTARSPPTQIASLPDLAPCGPPLTGASSMWIPCSAKSFCDAAHHRRRIGREVEAGRALLQALDQPVLPSATASTSGGPGSDRNTTSQASATALGDVGPLRAGREVHAGVLAPHVVHDELVAGLLQIGRHAGAHGTEPDEPYLHARVSLCWVESCGRAAIRGARSAADRPERDTPSARGSFQMACRAGPGRRPRSGRCATGSAATACGCRGSGARTGCPGRSHRRLRPCR